MMFWHFFARSSVTAQPCWSSRNPSNFIAITDHPSAREVLKGCGPHCGALWHLSTFQSVSIPGLHRVQWGGRFSVGLAISLFLSVLMLPHHSRQISETAAIYYTPAKYWERWVYTLWKQGQNWTDPGSWCTSQTLVELGLKVYMGSSPYFFSFLF
jgi:hypothetical protein